MRSLKLTLLATVLAVTASSLAMADALVAVKSETVNYEDLRLSSRVGVAVLYGRIRTAAERACAPLDAMPLSAKTKYRACLDEAVAKAVVSVNHAGLTEYAAYKRNGAVPAETVPSVSVVAKSP